MSTSEDKIFLEQLKVPCIIGIFDWERKKKQNILIDLKIPTSIKKAAKSDHIRDAVDYKKIAKRIIQFVSKSKFFLLETLTEELAATLLKEFRLKSITLRVSKPGAIRGSKNVGIEITRRRK